MQNFRVQCAIQTKSAHETHMLGQLLGEHLPAGAVIAASGALGMGKTVFAQGLAQGLGIAGPVVSPTFTYIQEYMGRLPFCHVDAYRLEGWEEEELAQIGLSDCFLSAKTAYVEWPEFIRPFLPAETINLHLNAVPQQPEWRQLLFYFDTDAHNWLTPLLTPYEKV